ncbi:hypothetical protein GCM10011390_41040 [Aureimonas endophytica]|uniref:Biopolymer transport protein ExbB n=1 Tax=Aureimonas endophytica TaxID=2027858 RepID=A0A916ZZ40_9HYPH|nr:tonB-system energizer ExbB [Aureimonas endophytica]GGE17685.1 hypothetical protein GCM10011390_41040 [Aureimonas endophytica]
MPIPCRRISAEGCSGKAVKRSAVLALALLTLGAGPAPAQDGAPASPPPAATSSQSAPAPEASPPATITPAAPPQAGDAAPAPGGETAPPPAPVGAATLPHDLSPWGMFMAADIVVKTVMSALALASLATWVIWLAKTLELVGAKTRARRALGRLERAESLGRLMAESENRFRRGPVAALVRSAVAERDRSAELAPDGVKERTAIALGRIEARAGRSMARGTGILATIGSISPFVGLFGTVWGIMNSFIGISQSNTTNLAVVAPGIAEALLATAIGLVAAIPAVVIYNIFSRAIAGYRAVLADASAEVMRHLSRDLDRERRAPAPRARPRLEAAE